MVRWLLVASLALAGWYAPSYNQATATPMFAAIDVGQGDSVYIGDTLGLLVDTGSRNSGASEKVRQLNGKIHAVLITHLHEDHMGAIEQVIQPETAAVFWNGITDGSQYEQIKKAVDKVGIPLLALAPGDTIRLGNTEIKILGPESGYRTSDDPNDTSVIARVDGPTYSALLTGDASQYVEEKLTQTLGDLDVDLIKVGHHGSKTATSETLLQATTPKVAIISAGKENRYRHPHAETTEKLKKYGIQTETTAERGTIIYKGGDQVYFLP